MKEYLSAAASRLLQAFLNYADRILADWGRHIAHGILSAAVQLRAYTVRRIKILADSVRARMGWAKPRNRRGRLARKS